MTRLMGDATRSNANALTHLDIQAVAGYDTGSPDILWTPPTWEMFPGKIQVHIDQGFGDTRSIEAHALVFDVESGAFAPTRAKSLIDANTSPRPTIYVNRGNLYATIASAMESPRWKGDIWLADPGFALGSMLPVLPSACRFVAVQYSFQPGYDVSAILDASWPEMPIVSWTEAAVEDLPFIMAGSSDTANIRRVQGLLCADGLPTIIDGDFGPQTTANVQRFQSRAGLTSDGIVGPLTWPMLLGV